MYRRRLEKTMLLLSLMVTGLVVFYWRIHNHELATIITEPTDDEVIYNYAEEKKEILPDLLPRAIVLWSQPYAGTFDLGNLLAYHQDDALVSFEPFAYEQPLHRAPEPNTTIHHHRLGMLNDLLHCRYHRHQDLVTRLVTRPSFQKQNAFLKSRCGTLPLFCDNGTFVSVVCRESSVHMLKVLRLGLKWVRPLLEDPDLDLKVIYLARDPRSLVYSRENDVRCDTPQCKDPAKVCAMLQEDLAEVPFLKQDFPDRFRYRKYEDFAKDVNETLVKELLSFSNTSSTRNLNFVRTGIDGEAFLWRLKMSFSQVSEIQDLCQAPLRAMRYRIFNTEEDYYNLSISAMDEGF